MNEQTYAETVRRLRKLNEVIADLDPAIRAEAFSLLKPYLTGENSVDGEDGEAGAGAGAEHDAGQRSSRKKTGAIDFDVLIENHESDKDSDNAALCLAIYYERHGRGPFQVPQIKGVADEFKLTVPARLDMTFKQAKRDGKEIVRKQADGWKVTPSGEKWLKATYGVTRGKEPVPDAAS